MIATDTDFTEQAIQWRIISEKYLALGELLELIPEPNQSLLKKLLHDHADKIEKARGSYSNHQAWEGGLLDHLVETMNIACQIYSKLSLLRDTGFHLHDVLTVMLLHDLEKAWKPTEGEVIAPFNLVICVVCQHVRVNHWDLNSTVHCINCQNEGKSCTKFIAPPNFNDKEDRRNFRDEMIRHYGIQMSDEMWNAIRYVEGVPDKEYSGRRRTMGRLAAFCHCCDILSARLWYDRGHERKWQADEED